MTTILKGTSFLGLMFALTDWLMGTDILGTFVRFVMSLFS
jgi:hypothetical protein